MWYANSNISTYLIANGNKHLHRSTWMRNERAASTMAPFTISVMALSSGVYGGEKDFSILLPPKSSCNDLYSLAQSEWRVTRFDDFVIWATSSDLVGIFYRKFWKAVLTSFMTKKCNNGVVRTAIEEIENVPETIRLWYIYFPNSFLVNDSTNICWTFKNGHRKEAYGRLLVDRTCTHVCRSWRLAKATQKLPVHASTCNFCVVLCQQACAALKGLLCWNLLATGPKLSESVWMILLCNTKKSNIRGR